MVPPKKDVFADLFQSANKNNQPKPHKLAMSQRQDFRQNDLDILSGTSSSLALGSGFSTPVLDPFDIFGGSSSVNSVNGSNTSVTKDNVQNDNLNRSSTNITRKVEELSLLDVDFTDAFQNSSNDSTNYKNINDSASSNSNFTGGINTNTNTLNTMRADPNINARSNYSNDNASTTLSIPSRQNTPNTLSRRDHIIAELIDIGFSIQDSNEAVSVKGINLQDCVNYIMNKNQSGSNSSVKSNTNSRPSSRNSQTQKTNNFSSGDWLDKGVSLFNQTKKTVLKNIDQFVDGTINQSGNSAVKDNRPAWMKSVDKYKDQATEKKYGGDDYGSDSENIDHQEINKFMQQIREKDKERNKKRLQNIRQAILTPTSSNKASNLSNNSTSSFEKPPSRISTPVNESSQVNTPKNSRSNSIRSSASGKAQPVQEPKSVLEPRFKPEVPEVDLLGISNSTKTSSIRDVAPLNQFDHTDFTTSKEKAHQSFKSGDYSTALESYLVCLNKLSHNHELRVVINSNLAVVYKMVGQLKNSLQSIDEALNLLSEDEINDESRVISDKPIKYWYTKLIICKAEVLEYSEKYEESLTNYSILIQRLGVVDRKITDGKRRVDKIVNPENYKIKPPSTPKSATPKPPVVVAKKPKSIQNDDELDGLQKEKIDLKVQQWVDKKQDNLRALLVELDDIIPSKISMNDKLRHLTGNDLMLPKQVKINYMKVISSIHPDKLASQCKDDKITELICKTVFIKLNQSWEQFKSQENV